MILILKKLFFFLSSALNRLATKTFFLQIFLSHFQTFAVLSCGRCFDFALTLAFLSADCSFLLFAFRIWRPHLQLRRLRWWTPPFLLVFLFPLLLLYTHIWCIHIYIYICPGSPEGPVQRVMGSRLVYTRQLVFCCIFLFDNIKLLWHNQLVAVLYMCVCVCICVYLPRPHLHNIQSSTLGNLEKRFNQSPIITVGPAKVAAP